MARILQTLASKIGQAFGRGKKPTPPRLGGMGHRGIAAGSLKPGEQDLSQENIDKWQMVGNDETQGFIYRGEPLLVHSTNVAMAQYHIDNQSMMIEFRNGSAYMYDGVTPQEALKFTQALSKGGEIWDTYRVRGSKTGHRKNYRRIK